MSDPYDFPKPHHKGDTPCDDCDGPNVAWHTDDLLWNRVIKDHRTGDGPWREVFCIDCFIARAEAFYEVDSWRLAIGPKIIERRVPPDDCVSLFGPY